jgi:chemotaxis protein histidine kinase CheA
LTPPLCATLSVFKYLQAAFTHHWNLLAFVGGMGFAVLSGHPDVLVPLVLAGETAYLGFLGTHPKFQRHIDAQEAKSKRSNQSETSKVRLERLLASLPESSRDRYQVLLRRCQQLRQIAADLKRADVAGVGESLDSMQTAGLDRLMWIFLRLLFTEYSLMRFLRQTSRDSIEQEAERVQARLASLNPQDQSPHAAKVRHTLEDSLATARARLENYDRAKSNHEYVQLEIARLENKIQSLVELAVNRQEPDYISSQVDQVAHSMLDTEKTMNELKYVTGLELHDDVAPPIMQSELGVQGR